VAELQENGIKIAIDDFGTGYNTPSNLSGIDKPDYVKLIYDASAETLEQGIDSALNSFDITQSDIIVEHIDSPLKSHIAATLGLHYQQGFLFNHR
jgi:EAL domain-containing protein (putative c-di-GMP-specific phosphodiesterase class I)